MYYKLYIDSVFALQAASNLYLLSLAGQILKCTATHKRILASAMLGAMAVCAAIVAPAGTVGCRLLICAIPVSMCMLRAAFGIRLLKQLFFASLAMAGSGFFLGSIMIWILNRLRTVLKGDISLIITLATGYLSYRLLLKMITVIQNRRENSMRTVVTRLPENGRTLRVQALLDTGNHLADPVSGAPVSLISKRLAEQIHPAFRPEKYHAVPFRSIGTDKGMLDAYEIPDLIIEEKTRSVRKEHVIVAICNTGISGESVYQMILNPRLLED